MHYVTCPACRKIGEYTELEIAPEGWYPLYEVNQETRVLGEAWFCGRQCLAVWELLTHPPHERLPDIDVWEV